MQTYGPQRNGLNGPQQNTNKDAYLIHNSWDKIYFSEDHAFSLDTTYGGNKSKSVV